MTAFEIIQVLTKGYVPVDRCGTAKFGTSDLSELSQLFGKHYSWSGHMFQGNVFYCFNEFNDDWSIEGADIIGTALDDDHCNVYIFKIWEGQ